MAGGASYIPQGTNGKAGKTTDHHFKPGNPGKPPGSKHRLSEAFVHALCEDFTANGATVVAAVRQNDPSTYLRVIAMIIPKEVEVKKSPVEAMRDAELNSAIDYLRTVIAGSAAGIGVGEEPEAVGKPH